MKTNMKEACAGTLAIFLNMMKHLVNPKSPFVDKIKVYKGAKPFHVLGFDILVDQNMKCWLIEINDHPSFNIYICKDPKEKGTDC